MKHLYSTNQRLYLGLVVMLCSFMTKKSNAQNLVLNPSFESVNTGSLICSWYTSQTQFNNAINNWTCPTGGSTDIFNTALATSCYCSPFSTHSSNPGNQAPRTGNGYVNIVTYGNGGCSPWREYIQGQLSSAMVVGQQYEVSMWVTLADKMSRGTNNIGVKFSTNPYSQAGNCGYYTTPDLNYVGPIILDKVNWVQIYFTYTPTVAGLDNFIIGNFFNDAATATAAASGVTTGNTIRYFVEDVVVAPITVLQTELEHFEANCEGNKVRLSWSTNSEVNNDYFTVERSLDGIDFYEIGKINGNGNSTAVTEYEWTDFNPINGTAYYRLKPTDIGGTFSQSELVAVDCQLTNDNGLSIYPNPFEESFVINLWEGINSPVQVSILDCTGRIIHEQKMKENTEKMDISIASKLVPGVYFVKIDVGSERYVRKLIKK